MQCACGWVGGSSTMHGIPRSIIPIEAKVSRAWHVLTSFVIIGPAFMTMITSANMLVSGGLQMMRNKICYST